MNNLIERFEEKALDPQVNWLNEFLVEVLDANHNVKVYLENYFQRCPVNDYDHGLKKFNLERWSGGDINPSLEIVLVDGEFKFATTHYGVLGPLSRETCNKQNIKAVIMSFFINPVSYLKEPVEYESN